MVPHEDEHTNNQPTETSPLLGARHDVNQHINGSTVPEANGKPPGTDEPAEDGSNRERQPSLEDRQRQYEGLPEVKKRMKYILPALAIGIFLAAGDQTIIVSSYGRIGSELNALNQTSWIATAYFLTLTSFQPLYGKLSDIFGRK